METQKEIIIDANIKGSLLFATNGEQNWILLIHKVVPDDRMLFKVYTHASYRTYNGHTFINPLKPGWWGWASNFKFYTPTEDQRRKMLEVLKKNRAKFISVLNKLIIA